MHARENTAENVAYGPWAGSRPGPREGEVRLKLKRATNGETMLRELYHAQPLRVLMPYRDRDDVFQAAIACVSGGLVGGDAFRVDIALDHGCQATVIGQAAEKVYRSAGPECLVETSLHVAGDAWLEYLPQETILFDRARLRRRTAVTLEDGARFLGGGILVFGRQRHGETLRTGFVHDAWTFHDGAGRLVWKDALHMDGDLATQLARHATFDGARAYGSLIYAGADAAAHLARVRAMPGSETLRLGATSFRNLLIARLIGRDPLELRNTFAAIWRDLRAAAAGLPAVMPRLWGI